MAGDLDGVDDCGSWPVPRVSNCAGAGKCCAAELPVADELDGVDGCASRPVTLDFFFDFRLSSFCVLPTDDLSCADVASSS